MRILLTGAAGFIGSHLSERLLREGHRVIGVDNFITGRPQNIEPLLSSKRFSFIEADVIQPLRVDQPLDWVMHFASPASPPKYLNYPLETLRVNGEGTLHLLNLARAHKARFFLASTSEIYGDPAVHPQPESYWGHVSCVGPRSVYDEAKRYAETLVHSFRREYGMSTRVIRIFNTYGPRMDPYDGRVVTNFVRQALEGNNLTIYGAGDQTRSFQYVDDLIAGIVKLMAVEFHSPVNLGNPEEYTMLELARLVIRLVGSNSRLVFEPLPIDDPRQRRPDITQARTLLNWIPKIPVAVGILRTIAYMRGDLPETAVQLASA